MRRLIADVRAHFLARWPSFFQGRVVAGWGQVGKLYVFCAVLAYSRVRFVRFSDNLGQPGHSSACLPINLVGCTTSLRPW